MAVKFLSEISHRRLNLHNFASQSLELVAIVTVTQCCDE